LRTKKLLSKGASQEDRSTGVQEFRSSGVQEFRSSESEISDFARRLFRGLSARELVGKFVCGSQPETKMEVTKKEVRGESKEVKRPEIDSAIIEELLKSS
jgi:hypothetical protein